MGAKIQINVLGHCKLVKMIANRPGIPISMLEVVDEGNFLKNFTKFGIFGIICDPLLSAG